jgi:hypothetical protein
LSRDAIFQALTIAAVLGLIKFVRDITILKAQVDPLVEWWRKTSIDALKIATNPTSKRLAELADKYISAINGKTTMPVSEKQELIDGLREVMNDKGQYADKRQSASLSLRFIESREGLTTKAVNPTSQKAVH